MNANMKPTANFCRNAAAAALSLIVALAASAGENELPRLRVSENQRFLVTADGKPFFWLGDTAWWIRQLPPPLVKHYLSTRARERAFCSMSRPTATASMASAPDT